MPLHTLPGPTKLAQWSYTVGRPALVGGLPPGISHTGCAPVQSKNNVWVSLKTIRFLLTFGLQTNQLLILIFNFQFPFFRLLWLITFWRNHTTCIATGVCISPGTDIQVESISLTHCYLLAWHTSFDSVWTRGKWSRHPKTLSPTQREQWLWRKQKSLLAKWEQEEAADVRSVKQRCFRKDVA